MAERSAYSLEETVISKQDMLAQLEQLGIQKGMLILVSADTTHLGYLMGGEQMLIEALMEAVGFEGTIVMPCFTPQHLDPACSKHRLQRQYWQEVRENTTPFDKKLSEPFESDALVYQFLRNEGVARSYHPLYSFAAWGKYAKLICDKHPLHFALGKNSPLGKLVELNGYCVLLGCEYEACMMFQMARYKGELSPVRIVSAPIEANHKVRWKNMLDVEFSTKNFSEIGEVMEDKHVVKKSYLGNGRCHLFSAREAYQLATSYFSIHHS